MDFFIDAGILTVSSGEDLGKGTRHCMGLSFSYTTLVYAANVLFSYAYFSFLAWFWCYFLVHGGVFGRAVHRVDGR